jgi:hypothetical protein
MNIRLLAKAVHNLAPEKEFVINDSVITWVGDAPNITQEQIDAEYSNVVSEYQANEYKQKRVFEYPSIGDQLDALFHAGVFPSDMAAQIQAIKDKYPKV